LIAVREFTSQAELAAHYAAIQKRCFAPWPKREFYVPPPPPKTVEAVKPINPPVDPKIWISQTMACGLFELEAEYGPYTGKLHNIESDRVTVKSLLRTICEVSGEKDFAIKSHRRDASIVRARQTLYWLCKHFTPLSLPEIGRRLGGKDHTSVLHGVRRIETVLAAVRLGECKSAGGVILALPQEDTPEAWSKLLLAINPWPYSHIRKR
jgi:hypothetical protein